MEDMEKETRNVKLYVRNPGGNAGSTAKQYRVSLPTKWVKEMGITPEERSVTLSFDGSEISIRKQEESK